MLNQAGKFAIKLLENVFSNKTPKLNTIKISIKTDLKYQLNLLIKATR